MTNEEKAKEIAEYLNQPNGSNSLLECHQAAMAMAEWKEQQLSEIIKISNSNSTHQYELGYNKGVEETKEKMIEKAMDWIKQNIKDYLTCSGYSECSDFKIYLTSDFYDDFKQAMEG